MQKLSTVSTGDRRGRRWRRPAKPRLTASDVGAWIAFAVLTAASLLALCLLVTIVAGCGATTASDGDAMLSPKAQHYLKTAMPKLEKMIAAGKVGDMAKASRLWDTIGQMPLKTTGDSVVEGAFVDYANSVRYWLIDDGSATLKDVEKAQEKAQNYIANATP
jgi:hypothetical protein